ncbi:MAG TPA: family 43 glycosylhydrolase [Gemmatimonadales bacterium]|nr:family 43 glycosylhydrolase [Gemmatimonadales bacterium]
MNTAGRRRSGEALAALLFATSVAAQSSGIRTYCNPLDIDYKYNFEQLNEGISYRSGADPVIVNHRGEYYLFVTASGGYWHSKDLLHWQFVTPSRWPFEDIVAPAAVSVGDTVLLMMSSFSQRPILYSTQPATGRFEFYNRLLPPLPNYSADSLPGRPGAAGPRDPALFRDPDNRRWYLYWGSSNVYPLYGIELDPSRRLAYMGQLKELIRLHPDQHGWERFGQDHRDTLTPYIEGAWMTKHGGRYYLQYARFRLTHSSDGKQWTLLADLGDEKRDRPNAYIELPRPVRTRYIRYEHGYVASPNLAIGDIRIFGNGDGPPPATPSKLIARRDGTPAMHLSAGKRFAAQRVTTCGGESGRENSIRRTRSSRTIPSRWRSGHLLGDRTIGLRSKPSMRMGSRRSASPCPSAESSLALGSEPVVAEHQTEQQHDASPNRVQVSGPG